ncbi:MAG TPA: O-antigen ligase domain-containing protein, partial [Phaeodactylibacter sp.]|nr:O-antigen ligase domain-containing protein [Phaeodactylibacter sp.]
MPNNSFSPELQAKLLFTGYAAIILLCVLLGMVTETYVLWVLPIFLPIAYLTIFDFRKLFYLLLICIPLSMEVVLPGGFGTDFPDEAIILSLLGIYMLYLLRFPEKINGHFLTHPITLVLAMHFVWTVATSLTSEIPLVSMKFSLSKFWYIVVFFFLAGRFLKTKKDIKVFMWCVLIPLLFTVVWTTGFQAMDGFSFAKVNNAVRPFYRNHVAYAAILACFIPVVWYLRGFFPKGSKKRKFLVLALLLVLVGIQFSYTRAAYVAVLLAVMAHFAVRYRLMKLGLALGFAFLLGIAYFLAHNNRYLDFSPDFEHTVVHHEFDNLIDATFKMEDISTVERFYRWIAGSYMIAAQPWKGVGPGNFHNIYKGYTVTSYQTYVSDNPEKSGIHCYYLMVLVEQGIIGFLFFLLLTIFPLILGERIYHQTKVPWRKSVVLFAMLSLIIIDALCLINDLIETDKVGSFYFMNLALLVNMDLANQADAAK